MRRTPRWRARETRSPNHSGRESAESARACRTRRPSSRGTGWGCARRARGAARLPRARDRRAARKSGRASPARRRGRGPIRALRAARRSAPPAPAPARSDAAASSRWPDCRRPSRARRRPAPSTRAALPGGAPPCLRRSVPIARTRCSTANGRVRDDGGRPRRAARTPPSRCARERWRRRRPGGSTVRARSAPGRCCASRARLRPA